MKINSYKIVCLSVLLPLLLLSSITSLASTVEPPYQQGAAIVVKGVVDSGKKGVPVTVVIPKDNIAQEDLKTLPPKEAVYYIDQVLTSSGGHYRFDIYLSAEIISPKLLLRIGQSDFTTPTVATVSYIAPSLIVNAVKEVSNAYNANQSKDLNREKMRSALSSDLIGLDSTIAIDDYNGLSTDLVAIDYMLNAVKNNPLEVDTDTNLSDSVLQLRTLFTKAVGLAMINYCETETHMDILLNKYAQALSLDLSYYNLLDDSGFGKDKEFVCKLMLGYELTDEGSAKNGIESALAVLKLNKTISWDQAKTVLTANKDVLGIDMGTLSRFSKIGNTDNYFKEFAKYIPFSDANHVLQSFDKVVEYIIESEIKKRPTGGGDSGGGRAVKGSDTVVQPLSPINLYSEEKVFEDLEGVSWAQEAINTLYKKGVISGKEKGVFAPNEGVTRAEFLKIIMEAFAIPKGTEINFDDVNPHDWFYGYIAGASQLGIVSGTSIDSFSPNNTIKRQDMAVILHRVILHNSISLEIESQIEATDEAEIDYYAKESVKFLMESGVIKGKGGGSFAPHDFTTRAEAAKLIYSLLNK